MNPVYRLMMAPKMATEIPATMMVLMPVPSHTIRSGARADLGRLFNTTRYGSRTSDNLGEYHSRVAAARLNATTSRKLTTVSRSVTPI